MTEMSTRMSGWQMAEPEAALAAFLQTLPITPRLLGLGEPTHGLEDFPVWRNRILRALVQTQGFRSVALESDRVAGERVNAYVTTGEGNLDDVMREGFSHGFGQSPANRALVEWLREHNAGRVGAEQVHFYGFDASMENLWAASPRQSLLALHTFLKAHLNTLHVDADTLTRLCGDDARWADPAAGMNPARSVGATAEAQTLRVLADDLLALLQAAEPGLKALPGFWAAQSHARTATGLLRYHAVMANPSPGRVARMLGARDLMMADHLSAIATREAARGPTLVFAHNVHLQRPLSGMSMGGERAEWWSAGAHLSLRLDRHYAFIASDLGEAARGGIEGAASDTLQGTLSAQTPEIKLFPASALTTLPAHLTPRRDAPRPYIPLSLPVLSQADGLLFLARAGGECRWPGVSIEPGLNRA